MHMQHAFLLLILGVILSVLQACAGGERLDAGPSGKTAPPITLVEMKGMPAEKAQSLSEFMAEAAGKRDIAIVQGAFGDGFRLDGSFTAKADQNGTVIAFQWKLSNASGELVHSFSGAEMAGVASGGPWSAAVPDVLRRIAASTADNLAARLIELGYAVRTGSLFPANRIFASLRPCWHASA
jgi:hypothetical protein